MKFKKITAIVSSVLMAGLTIGSAAAATFPAPFVKDGVGDFAVVHGSNAELDRAEAGKINTALSTFVKGTSTVEGGEAFTLYKDNDKLHFGDSINTIISSTIDDNDMSVLADGDYDSGQIDSEYEQEITLGSKAMSLITDSDLNDEEPTIGFAFDNDEVLTYKITFDDPVQIEETTSGAGDGMEGTDFPLFGKSYYVLDTVKTDGSEKITLLNSADKTIISEGETVTIDGHTVSIEYITSTDAKFNVDGELTDKLSDGESYELEDEYWIVLSENLYSSKDGTVSKAEISLGSGKVVLEHGQEVEVNDDAVDGLTVSIDGDGTDLTSLSLKWETDGEVFLTEGDTIEMPVFGEFSLFFNGLDFGSTTEKITVENGDTLTLSMGNYDVELLHNDTSSTYVGGDEAKLVTITASESKYQSFAIGKDQRFLATMLDTDLSDVETAYYEVQSLNNDTTKFDLSLNDLIGTDDVDFVDASTGDDDDLTDAINLKVLGVYDSGDSVANTTYFNTTISEDYVNHTTLVVKQDFAVFNITSDNTLHWDIVVSEEGMIVEIPTSSSDTIDFYETADDGDLDTGFSGTALSLATDYDSDDKLFAKVSSGVTMVDETTDDKTVGYVADVHATKVMQDSDAHTLEIEYYADEVSADLQLISGGEVSTATGALGVPLVIDSEIESVKSKNLVIVGGSCINSAAATVLGGAYCGEAFTEATGVANGEFLIKGVQDAFTEGKVALLVAGYETTDTSNAATFLTKKGVLEKLDTSKTYKGASATEATLVTEAN